MKKLVFTTGSKKLDDLIGGYETGIITLAYGENGAGKTTYIAYTPIASISKFFIDATGKLPDNSKFFVIDTEGGFDIDRMEQILEAWGLPIDDVMRHVEHVKISDFDEQHKYVTSELPKTIKDKKIKPLLIALDTAVAIYRGIVTRTPSSYKAVTIQQYAGKIDLQLTVMRGLAEEYNCLSTVSSWEKSRMMIKTKEGTVTESEVPMLGGRQMGYIPKSILEFKILDRNKGWRFVYLYKHRSKPSGRWIVVKMTDRGFVDLSEEEAAEAAILVEKMKLLENLI